MMTLNMSRFVVLVALNMLVSCGTYEGPEYSCKDIDSEWTETSEVFAGIITGDNDFYTNDGHSYLCTFTFYDDGTYKCEDDGVWALKEGTYNKTCSGLSICPQDLDVDYPDKGGLSCLTFN